MEIVNGVIILKTFFILLQCSCYMKADGALKEYKVLPRGYNIFMQTGVTSFYGAVNVTHRNDCFKVCALETFCHILRFDNGNCHIFHSMKDKLKVESVVIPSPVTYYETELDDEWFKIYFVKSGSGFLVAKSFLGNEIYEKCTRSMCSDFFRSNLIDVWSNLPIHKVKLLARKDENDVMSVIFNGTHSDKESWFKVSRAVESPWSDFNVDNTYISYRNCSSFEMCNKGETGWFSINYNKVYCKHNSNDRPPFIWYSNETHFVNFKDGAFADDFSIFISLK